MSFYLPEGIITWLVARSRTNGVQRYPRAELEENPLFSTVARGPGVALGDEVAGGLRNGFDE